MPLLAANLPVLPVVLPLIAAAASAALRSRYIAWAITAATFWIGFFMAVLLSGSYGVTSYALGGHLPPIGIEYRLDDLNRYLLLVLTFIAAVMIPYARQSIDREVPEKKQPLFYAMLLLCYAGLVGILVTGDIFNIYVFIEISSLALYTLVALGQERRALVAAIEYLVLGTIGATFFLIGIFFLYAMTGTLNLADLAVRLPEVSTTPPVAAGFAFLILGLLLKIAAFPLHGWLIGAYTHAPSFISAFAAATATKVFAYLVIRLSFAVFGFEFSFGQMQLGPVLLVLGSAGIIAGTLSALMQENIKRMLAYSSIAQMGYILLGLGLATEAGLHASLTHIANHALAKGALFLAVGCVAFRTGGVTLKHFAGIGRKMPWTMAAFVLAGLSLVGVPGTAGFISKWLLISALLSGSNWLLLILVLASSLPAIVYLWRVVEAAYFREASGNTTEAPLMLLLPTWALVLANVYFGLTTSWTLGLAGNVAAQLMAGGR